MKIVEDDQFFCMINLTTDMKPNLRSLDSIRKRVQNLAEIRNFLCYAICQHAIINVSAIYPSILTTKNYLLKIHNHNKNLFIQIFDSFRFHFIRNIISRAGSIYLWTQYNINSYPILNIFSIYITCTIFNF